MQEGAEDSSVIIMQSLEATSIDSDKSVEKTDNMVKADTLSGNSCYIVVRDC